MYYNQRIRPEGALCALYIDVTHVGAQTVTRWIRACVPRTPRALRGCITITCDAKTRRTGDSVAAGGQDSSWTNLGSIFPREKLQVSSSGKVRRWVTQILRLIALGLTSADSIYPTWETRWLTSRAEEVATISIPSSPRAYLDEVPTDSGGRHLCVTHVNLFVTIKSLYSILLMPFLISRCIDDTFSISLLLCVSLLLFRAKHQNTRCVSRGPLSWLFCNSTYRHVLSLYVKQVSILYVYMNELGLTNSTTLLPPPPVDIKLDTKRMTGEDTRFCIFAKFRLQRREMIMEYDTTT